MEKHHIHIEDFEKEKKDRKNFHLYAPLSVKCDYLAPDHCLDLEEANQAYQGARDYENGMIKEEKHP